MEILSTSAILVYSNPVGFGLVLFILLLAALAFLILAAAEDSVGCGIISAMLFLIALCYGFCTYNSVETDTGLKRYEVILDDDYSVSDLYEKYNIVEQRGKIWVIEEKETIDSSEIE